MKVKVDLVPCGLCRDGVPIALRTLIQNEPASRILGHDVLDVAGRNPTSGGSREMEVKVPTTIPTGVPSASRAVTTDTPVG